MLLTDKDLGVSVRLGLLATAAVVFAQQWVAIPAEVPASVPFVALLAIVAVRVFVAFKGAANTTADEKLEAVEDGIGQLTINFKGDPAEVKTALMKAWEDTHKEPTK